jgi:hypothetical protein
MVGIRRNRAIFGAAIAAASLAGIVVATPAIAQSSYEALVNQLLDAAQGIARERGYSSTHSRHNGSLSNDQTETVTLDLDAGTSYLVIGVCDGDCSDLDLWINDENGYEIDSDVLEDDTPILEVTPVRNARFSVRTKMIACSAEPCYYGLGVYGR